MLFRDDLDGDAAARDDPPADVELNVNILGGLDASSLGRPEAHQQVPFRVRFQVRRKAFRSVRQPDARFQIRRQGEPVLDPDQGSLSLHHHDLCPLSHPVQRSSHPAR